MKIRDYWPTPRLGRAALTCQRLGLAAFALKLARKWHAAWMQTTDMSLLAVSRSSPPQVRTPVQDSHSAHGSPYSLLYGTIATSLVRLSLPQAVGNERREHLSGRVSPADAKWMPGRVCVHLVAPGGIEIRSGLEQSGAEDDCLFVRGSRIVDVEVEMHLLGEGTRRPVEPAVSLARHAGLRQCPHPETTHRYQTPETGTGTQIPKPHGIGPHAASRAEHGPAPVARRSAILQQHR